MKRILISGLALVLMAGCGVNTQFVYKPGPADVGAPKVPVKVVVLPFQDGTENFKKTGSVLSLGTRFNLVKGGMDGTITPVTPELWSKLFADELTSSGRFRSARFVYSPSEIMDGDLRIDGTVTKAYWANSFEAPNDFAFTLVARTRTDNRVVWEKEVARQWKTPGDIHKGCGLGIKCMIDRLHGEVNKAMQSMFAEAGTDLAERLASGSGSVSGAAAPGGGTAGDAPKESVESTIDRILQGK